MLVSSSTELTGQLRHWTLFSEKWEMWDNKFQHLSAGPFICTWKQGVYWDKVDLQWYIINSLWYVPGDGYLPPRHTETAAFSLGESNSIRPKQTALRGKKYIQKTPDANYSPFCSTLNYWQGFCNGPLHRHHESFPLNSQHFRLEVLPGIDTALTWFTKYPLLFGCLWRSLETHSTSVSPVVSCATWWDTVLSQDRLSLWQFRPQWTQETKPWT